MSVGVTGGQKGRAIWKPGDMKESPQKETKRPGRESALEARTINWLCHRRSARLRRRPIQ
jgi:hypothetical protein